MLPADGKWGIKQVASREKFPCMLSLRLRPNYIAYSKSSFPLILSCPVNDSLCLGRPVPVDNAE